MTSDQYVGFLKRPVGLEPLLEKEGYIRSHEPPASRSCMVFEHPSGWPTLFYSPRPAKPKGDEVPNWKAAGYAVVSELNINFTHKEFKSVDEANRLAEKITKAFNGVLYDPNGDEYFAADEV